MLPDWTRLDSRLLALIQRFGIAVCTSELVFDGADWLHITATARVWSFSRTHVAWMWSAKNGRFQLPGAHGEGDFDLRSVALREARRALGLVPDTPLNGGEAVELIVEKIAEYWNTPAHLHLEVVFEFRARDDHELVCGARWVQSLEAT